MTTEHPERELSDAERAYNDMECKILDDEQAFTDHVWDSLVNDGMFFNLMRSALRRARFYKNPDNSFYAILRQQTGDQVMKMAALALDAACTREAEKVG